MRVIFDLDNCLADDEWRLKLINWDATDPDVKYANYHRACSADMPVNLQTLTHHLGRGHRPTFFTARPVSVERETRAWIEEKLCLSKGSYDLLMRNLGDHRHGVQVKEGMLEHLWNPDNGYEMSPVGTGIFAAYDDREDIVRMYAKHGIVAYKLMAHKQCALTPPDAKPELELRGAAAALQAMAQTFAERNAVYKDNYKTCAKVLDALYPEGMHVRGAKEHEVMHLWSLLLVKVTRFVHAEHKHIDSVHDIAVYAAMIESILKEQQQ